MHLALTQPDTALELIRSQYAAASGRVFVLVPELTTATYLKKALADLDSKKLTIGTRKDLFRPWQGLTDLIVEDPLNEAYKSDMTPRYAAADVARELARIHGATLTYLSPALSTVNQYLADKKVLTVTDHKPYWPEVIGIDMVQERHQRNTPSILSRAVQDALLNAYDDGTSFLFYSPRRAYASHVDCTHCHAPLMCATCGIPMRLHRTSEDMCICYHCAAYRTVPKQCPACRIGILKPAGLAGSQKIAEAINTCLDRHGMSKITIPILDSDLVKTDAQERDILTEWKKAPHPFLVATQKILSHRYTHHVNQIAVIEADALVYNPDFRTQERLIYQLEKLADFAPRTLFLQYWSPSGALAHAPNRTWHDFYAEELRDRKTLGWPPFTRLVKLSFSHRDRSTSSRSATMTADRLQRTAAHLKIAKSVQVLGPTPALVERAGGKWTQRLIIKTTLAAEPLRAFLFHVPAGWTIDVDPRSIT